MTDTVGATDTPRAPAAPGANGTSPADARAQAAPPTPVAAPPATSPRPTSARRRLVLGALVFVALVAGGVAGYRWWLDSTTYVSTDNAQIAGRLVQVGSLAAGRVATVRYDVGDRVGRDEVVATLHVPVVVGATSSGVPRVEFRPTNDTLVEVRAPVSGVVIARGAHPSDTVPAGQPLLTIVDPAHLWVTANIEETQIRRVRLGQPVMVRIDALDLDLPGRVVAITPASAATFSLLPSQNVSGNYTRVTQLIPVRVALEQPDPRLMIGTSASVRIRVAD